MTDYNNFQGLSSKEAAARLDEYGKNELIPEKKETIIKKILHILSEPMFLLLLIAAVIYFVLGEPRDGIVMLIFVVGIISIDIVQQWKTDKTLHALKDLSAPHITVLRDRIETVIPSIELVPGDLMLISEGVKIPADGVVMKCSDLCIDESSLTGESEGVWKIPFQENNNTDDYWLKDHCYAGTLVIQGSAYINVVKTGTRTEYGKIGSNIAAAPDRPTPLEKQTRKLIRTSAVIAGILLILVSVFTWFNLTDHQIHDRLIESILAGVTLAMAMIPEEFPVILTVFLSMGAWRLAKKNSLVRRLPAVETLGSVSVLCVDKTGTITLNQMTLQETWTYHSNENDLAMIMGMACETEAYDPMEKAMLEFCAKKGLPQEDLFCGKMIHEYAFTNELKMMGHIWNRDNQIILAAKGSPERIVSLCELEDADRNLIDQKIKDYSSQGYRVIGIAHAYFADESDFPGSLPDAKLTFQGLVALSDPPRETIKRDIQTCYDAGIRVVMITGDNGFTASAIAKKVGISDTDEIITGDQLDLMSDEDLCKTVQHADIFSRVIPEHKMRIVKAFKQNGETVAMTGDGVNDAPALKYADIGIAMGKRGSEVSREAADLILLDDNFTTIVETIHDGRRIFDNIRKAIGYVFTIHIPIAFASLLGPFLGIASVALMLLPLHVVLLEILIDPTCSVVLERQPAEQNVMKHPPRNPKEKLLTPSLLTKSFIQGIVVFAFSFGTYYLTLIQNELNGALARTMGLTIIMIANLVLVQVNSSEHDSVISTCTRLLQDKVVIAINLVTFLLLALIIYTPLSSFIKTQALTLKQLVLVVLLGILSVIWYEIVKLFRRMKLKNK